MANLNYIIKGTFDGSAVEKAKGSFDGLSSSIFSGATKAAAGFAAVTAAAVAATAAAVEFVASANKAEQDSIRLAVVQQNTFGKLGLTLQDLKNEADKLKDVTLFDDNSIQQAQAVLLEIGAITKESLSNVLEASADLAAFLGTDLKNAASTLGKALAEPAQALGALERAGIRFNEAETKMIKSLVDAGKSAEAQDVILKKLNDTIGGAAKAMGDSATGGAVKLKNASDDLKNSLASLAGLTFGGLIEWLDKVVNKINDLLTAKAEYEKAEQGKTVSNLDLALKQAQKELEKAEREYYFMRSQAGTNVELIKLLDEAYKKRVAEINATINRLAQQARSQYMTQQGAIYIQQQQAQQQAQQQVQPTQELKEVKEAAGGVSEAFIKLRQQQAAMSEVLIDGVTSIRKMQSEYIAAIVKEAQLYLESLESKKHANKLEETQITSVNYGLLPDMSLLSILNETFKPFIDNLVEATLQLSIVSAIFNYVGTIVSGVMDIIGNLINSALEPIAYVLTILGKTIGAILVPIIQILAPIIKAVADVFIWLYNKAIVPFINAIIFVLNTIKTMVAYIWNGIASAINAALGWAGVHVGYMSAPASLSEGFIQPIAYSTGETGTTGQTSTYVGAAASYSGNKEVNIYINFTQSFVNGDARAIALMLRDEIRAAEALGY